jgi:very-short-patch-repair endonuclease
VVAIPHAGDIWMQHVMAVSLWGGRAVAASHRTAGALWRLDGIEPVGVEVSTVGRKESPREWLTIHETRVRFSIQRRNGIAVTSVARTIVDVASVVSPTILERAVEEALRRRLTTIVQLTNELHRLGGRGRRGASSLARILADHAFPRRPTDSELERILLRLLKKEGLPAPRCQYRVTSNERSARLDFAYPEVKLGIECDSYRWHSGRAAWAKDRVRSNELVGEGWRILHTTWEEIRAGAPGLIAALRRILGQQELL